MAVRAITANLIGGEALKKHLLDVRKRLGSGATVKVGFLESATYPAVHGIRGTKRGTTSVAQAAFWNEFGTKHSPPRPAIRSMIASKSPRWGVALGNALRHTKYDARAALRIMGEGIQGQLVESITQFSDPANAPRTVEIKGFDKPWIDEGILLRSVDYQIIEGDDE